MKFVILVFISVLVSSEKVTFLRFRKFKNIAVDHKPNNTVLTELKTTDRNDCLVACAKEEQCGAINHRPSGSECDLLNNLYEDMSLFSHFPGNNVYVKLLKCSDRPCQNGGTCEDISPTMRNGTFRQHICSCPPEYCGLDCQKTRYVAIRDSDLKTKDTGDEKTTSTVEECYSFCQDNKHYCLSAGFDEQQKKCYTYYYPSFVIGNEILVEKIGFTFIHPVDEC
ncbi:venom prothrombin activator trocarin-D-like [Limulus polyphemus]|uniref:Venom prothrombin activator trocarin-D-like n=1 Tax=Limulus polyphemus TaxID=6850 RepID=A0ABM1B8F2_LIMPO|nr:venom prothrombin activator trocarin-D-like [Limulus polyphemus]